MNRSLNVLAWCYVLFGIGVAGYAQDAGAERAMAAPLAQISMDDEGDYIQAPYNSIRNGPLNYS